jgi:diguanylate cyclase (GGDEF)-like protein/PAS domain S-box-containing protein
MNIASGLSPEILNSLYDGVYVLGTSRKIEFWNKAAERISGYPFPEVLGKGCFDHILTHLTEDGQNICHTPLCPIEQAFSDGKIHETKAYLQHRAGHRVPVDIRTIPFLDEQGKVIKVIEIFREQTLPESVREKIVELEKLSLLDPLTGVGNRRFAEITLASRLAESQRNVWQFGVLFIDIDKFKSINDRFGHHVGDQVLKMVSKTLVNTVRSYDSVTRWGGEEFVVMVINVNAEKLPRVAEKLRRFVEKSSLTVGDQKLGVTVSVGAALARPDDTQESLVKRADQAMYRCKQAGGNCVRIENR